MKEATNHSKSVKRDEGRKTLKGYFSSSTDFLMGVIVLLGGRGRRILLSLRVSRRVSCARTEGRVAERAGVARGQTVDRFD